MLVGSRTLMFTAAELATETLTLYFGRRLVIADHLAAIHRYERNKRFGIDGVAEELNRGVAVDDVDTSRVEAIRLRVVAAIDELALVTVVVEHYV